MVRRRRTIDDDAPRLPRGRGLALSVPQIVRIVMVATALIALIVLQKPCSRSMSRFVTSFSAVDAGGVRIDAAPAVPDGVMLSGSMTPAELEAAIAKARSPAGLDAGLDAATDGGR